MKFLTLSIISVICIEHSFTTDLSPTVQTKTGIVLGQQSWTIDQNLPYLSFWGIPYAEPPLNKLRFQPPVPKTSWKGIWNATFERSDCIQGKNPVTGSEDCLYLNVYTPQVPTKHLPVMVFIYGGGFEGGTSKYSLYGPDYLLENEVIVVTLNYRLGIFGFMTTDTLDVPGNNGLKDQALALRWVQENIELFGGDPGSVTIFGQSAGSASVSYHLQSPLSKGLFNKAIMESGVSLSLWALSRNVAKITRLVASQFNIPTSSGNWTKVVEEMQQIDAEAIQLKTQSVITTQLLVNNPLEGLMLGPVREPEHKGAFFTQKSHELLSNSDSVQNMSIIVGFNSLEGAASFNSTLFRVYLTRYDLLPCKLAPIDLNVWDQTEKTTIGLKIKERYFPHIPISMSNVRLMKFISDDQFVRPTREFVKLIYENNDVYFYEFSYEGNLGGLGDRPFPGVAHSEELAYIWRTYIEPSAQDIVVRKRMTTMWTNFAKYGKPTVGNSFEWKRVTNDNLQYLDIGKNLVMKENVKNATMTFWDDLFGAWGVPPFDTY